MHALEKEMATHSSILAWRIPGTEKPVYEVAQSRTRLKQLSRYADNITLMAESKEPLDESERGE